MTGVSVENSPETILFIYQNLSTLETIYNFFIYRSFDILNYIYAGTTRIQHDFMPDRVFAVYMMPVQNQYDYQCHWNVLF